jgi:glycosyltransferase involved in cell wall biosynthesis
MKSGREHSVTIPTDMKVAIVYDRVNKWGGAERVLLSLKEIFPEAHLFTSVYNSSGALWAKDFRYIKPSFLQKIPGMSTRHELMAPLMPIAFESFDFSKYDLVISVTSEAAKGIITRGDTLHICYCLTPTRYLWSGYRDYFDSLIKRIVAYPFVYYLRKWDKVASYRPDVMIGISKEVCNRIEKYYGRKSVLIYPPVTVFKPKLIKRKSRDYYLVVGRLVRYKKVGLVIQVFNDLGKKLVVVGTGSEESNLKKIAHRNIVFVKGLTDVELTDYYVNCKALIAPQREDFGLVMAEAQALGVPVIAYKKGGGSEIVKDGLTGVLFEKQTKESIISAIKRHQSLKYKKENFTKSIEKFSKQRFKKEVFDLINKTLKGTILS